MVQVTVEQVTKENVDKLRKFDLSVYPIQYPPKFYSEVVDNPLARMLMHRGTVVAASASQVKFVGATKNLYIQALGVISLYREQGFGNNLLDFIETDAEDHRVDVISLHVHTVNLAAIRLYEKRGFKIKETVERYYQRLSPTSAYLMEKRIS